MEEQIHSKQPKEEFHCKIDGCKQSFTTEVYRNVHTKKHDLSLNLEMSLKGAAAGLFTDQTPTPTRLIGKCEEVGLFEDLQKVNPFDETFRRAVESGASGSPLSSGGQSPPTLSVPCCRIGEGETLHTPHIFPSNIDRTTQDAVAGDNENVAKHRLKPKISYTSPRTKQHPETIGSTDTAKQTSRTKRVIIKRKAPVVVNILPKPPSLQSSQTTEMIPLVIIPSAEPHIKIPIVGTGSGTSLGPILVKEKLKKHLAKVRETGKSKKEKLPAEQLLHNGGETPEETDQMKKPIKKLTISKSTEERAYMKHERWKAAAKRYRIRVKNSQDQQHYRNIQLEDENLRLRTEIAALRHAHRNCSFTREQNIATAWVQGTAHNIATAVGGNLESFVAGQEATVMFNPVDPQQTISLSTPQQRLITSHIIEGHSMNRNPIFIVIAPGSEPVIPVVTNGVSTEKLEQNS